MPIVPGPVGFRGVDGVVPTVVGYAGSANLIATTIGYLDGNVLLRAALDGNLDISSAIITGATILASVDGTVDLQARNTLLAQFTLEAAASADTTVEVATKSSVTLKNLLDAILKLES